MRHKLVWFSKNRIREASFEDIFPFWRDHLWSGRKSAITPCSAIDFDGSINMELIDKEPFFWVCWRRNQVIGVISGFCTSSSEFRIRGLWVKDEYRSQGVGSLLLGEAFKKARALNRPTVWTMPRASAKDFYKKNGFQFVRETSEFEFGPHYFAARGSDF